MAALLAPDIERDAGMTNPGTSACLPGVAELSSMFANHIEQLGKLKEKTLKTEQELRSKVTSLEQEKGERDEKITRLEHENFTLKENCQALGGGVAPRQRNLTLQDTSKDWKVKYEDMKKEFQNLQEELRVIRSGRACIAEPQQISTEEELPVTMDHKLYLSNNIPGIDFKHVLRHLSVPDTEVTNIYDAHTKDPKECCIQGLKIWKMNKGKRATVWALIQGLLKSGLREVAEGFCEKHGLHQLLTKIGETDYPVTTSVLPLALESEEDVQFVSADFADTPSSPPACPTNACPLHEILWPHLRHADCLDDLHQELGECVPFTTQQLQKLTNSFQNDSLKQEFLAACGTGSASTVLDEWAKRQFPASTLQNKVPVMKLGKMLRKLERQDIRKVLLSFLQSGAIGPSMDEKIYIRKLCFRTLHDIGKQLSLPQLNDMHDWRSLASDIGFSDEIGLLSNKNLPGCEVLQAWKTGNEATVGKLYEWAVKEKRWDVVKIMENDMSNSRI